MQFDSGCNRIILHEGLSINAIQQFAWVFLLHLELIAETYQDKNPSSMGIY